jgi:hypothetical protein
MHRDGSVMPRDLADKLDVLRGLTVCFQPRFLDCWLWLRTASIQKRLKVSTAVGLAGATGKPGAMQTTREDRAPAWNETRLGKVLCPWIALVCLVAGCFAFWCYSRFLSASFPSPICAEGKNLGCSRRTKMTSSLSQKLEVIRRQATCAVNATRCSDLPNVS